ncbi:MAG TPA: methyltransferase domain-containing protein [Acidimicrobiales bacterium]|nr:methyltransferase domain-containing protein [Acidimicrobiales bacterium]
MSDLEAWDRRTAELLEQAYLAAGAGPGGSGSRDTSAGAWRAKRQHLCVPMDTDGTWLDVGCANGHLLATLPAWCAERDVRIEPYGLELLPALAERARSLQPGLADRIWTGSVMSWKPARRFRYVTTLDDLVPPGRLADLVARLLREFVEPGGRLIVSSYTGSDSVPRPLFDNLGDAGYPPDGLIRIDRPRRHPLLTAWIDA